TRSGTYHQLTQRSDTVRLVIGQYQEQLVVIGHVTERGDIGGPGHRTHHVSHGQLLGPQLGGIDLDMQLADIAPLDVDASNAFDARQQRAQLVLCKVVQLRRGQGVAAQTVGRHGFDDRRIHAYRVNAGAGWQVGKHLAYRCVDLEVGAAHVGTPVE